MATKSNDLLESLPAILEASSEAIASVDRDGRILGFNPQFRILLGLPTEEVSGAVISHFFKDIDDLKIASETKEDYQATLLTRSDGTILWVLVRIMPVGNSEFGHFTLLVQEPESVRRIIDRLDYVENYDIATGIFNHRKGILEFEQLQISNLSGGCFLLQIDSALDGYLLDEYVKNIAAHFVTHIKNGFSCRYSDGEILSVFTSESSLPVTIFFGLIEAVKAEVGESNHLKISYTDWLGGTLSINSIIDTLKESLQPIEQPDLFDNIRSHRDVTSRSSFVSKLHTAMDAGEFFFYIQPQLSSQTRQVIGGELLVRWSTPSGKIIQPSEFVNFLEQGDFANRFYDWSLKNCIDILKRLKNELSIWMPLSLNLATSHISNTLLIEALLNLKKIHQIPDRILEVEITERILAEDQASILKNLELLADNGINIAIDDFGTGYSSLSYLRQFPLDRLKIDKVFVSNLDENEEDRLIVNSIISLAHVLGLEVIAEGVEEPFQAGFLKSLSCEYFQGYLTGKPMPVNEFIAFVKDNSRHSSWEAEPTEYLGARHLDRKPKPVKWKKSFSTDIVSIDNEHRALIDALNQFSDQYLNNPESFDVAEAMDGIATEAVKHFEHEEQVMRNIGYPRYETHKEKHEWLIADISKRRREIESKNEEFEEIIKYLKYWLMRHLVSEDTHLNRYINHVATDRRL